MQHLTNSVNSAGKEYIKLKTLLILIFGLTFLSSKATNYYLSNSGSDGNSGTTGSPWQNISKLNSVWLAGTFAPGDSILFNRGDTFYGEIIVSESGTLASPIVLSAYGTGAKPVITGFTTLTGWSSNSNGTWSSINTNLGASLNMVTLDNTIYAMGRYPNSNATGKGYLNFENHTGSTSITDNQLTGTPNWAGATLVVRINRYIIDRSTVTTHSGATLTYSPAMEYDPSNGFGYFIENDLNTLDDFGEWYYDPINTRVTMYFGDGVPTDYIIKAASIDTLFEMRNFDNVVLNNLSFTGANERALDFYSVDIGVSKVTNCDILYSGQEAIVCGTSKKMVIDNNNIQDANIHGIFLSGGDHFTVTNNTVKRIAMFNGMMGDVNTNTGIRANADDCLIQYNNVDSTGYVGIREQGDNNIIRNNFVQHYCTNLDDGGGVYTANQAGGNHSGNKIVSNVIINGNSAIEGTTSLVGATSGVYLDDNTNGMTVDSNAIANNSLNGIFMHNNYSCNVRFNNVYNSAGQQIMVNHNSPESNFRNILINNNVFLAKIPTQFASQFRTDASDMNFALWGTFNNNYHARPLDQSTIIRVLRPAFTQNMTIPDWYTLGMQDQNSLVSPKVYANTINPDDSIRFEYNATKVSKSVSLPGTFINSAGTVFTNLVTLQPFTSQTLMQTAYTAPPMTGTPPTVSVSTVQTNYVAPATITLTADVSDSIDNVKWYANATLLSTLTSAPYTLIWNSVPAGSYSVTAVATKISGLSTTSASKTFTVVNPPSNAGELIYLRLNKLFKVE